GDGRDIFGGLDALMCCNILYSTGEVNQAYYSDGLGTVGQVAGGPTIDVGSHRRHSLTVEGLVNPGHVTQPPPFVGLDDSTNQINPLGVQLWIAGQFTNNGALAPGTLSAALWAQGANSPITNSSVVTVGSAPFAITNGGWQHVALTYDGANALLYVNGLQ